MRLAPLVPALALVVGCASDFDLEQIRDPEAGVEDTGLEAEADEEPEEEAPEEDEEPEEIEEEEEGEPEEEPPEETEPDPEPEDDCEGVDDVVYVIDQDSSRLFTYAPDTTELDLVDELDCTMWGDPESMAVARDGFAYVRYSDDTVYEVDLESLDCALTDYDPKATGFGSFGMGFATESDETWRDNMFVANDRKLARMDTATGALTQLGKLPSQSELTGTAEGQLWAFLPLESPAALVEVDQEDAGIVSSVGLSAFPSPYDIDTFAFAAWGGSFHLFVRVYGMGESTAVYEVTGSGSMTKVVDGLGINVVGAGVSTCASTE